MRGSYRAVARAKSGKVRARDAEMGRKERITRSMGLGMALTLLLAAFLALAPSQAKANPNAGAQVSVGISVNFGPPPIPVYVQPMCPGPGYIWTPGYWAWDPAYGYYWVPGTWVMAPFVGALWTPGYWGWGGDGYFWHPGYWGPRVGFYGGINYGFGYFGVGYVGGYWRDRDFYYNRFASPGVVNVVSIRNVYINRVSIRNDSRVSYNGGDGGIDARASREDMVAYRDRRFGPRPMQTRQEGMARGNRDARWTVNHGQPRIAATRTPGRFMGSGVVRATRAGGNYRFEQQARQPQRYRQQPQQQQRGGFRPFGQQSRSANGPNQRNQGNRNQPRPNQRPAQQQMQMRQQPQQQRGGYRPFGQPAQRQTQQRQMQERQQQMQQREQQMRQQQQRGNYNRPMNANRPQQMRQPQPQRQMGGAPSQQRGNPGRQEKPQKGGKGDGHGNPHGRG